MSEVLVSESILNSVKQFCGYRPDYDVIDSDFMMLINSDLATLCQLGIGPKTGFRVLDDSATWDQFLEGRTDLGWVQEYISIKTRLIHDPPTSSSILKAYEEKVKELEWRIVFKNEEGVVVDAVSEDEPDVIF